MEKNLSLFTTGAFEGKLAVNKDFPAWLFCVRSGKKMAIIWCRRRVAEI
jgi:hypothetical protein